MIMDPRLIQVFVAFDQLDHEAEELLNAVRAAIRDMYPEEFQREDCLLRVIYHLNSHEQEWDHIQRGFRLPYIFRYLKELKEREDEDSREFKGFIRSLYEKEKGRDDPEGYLEWRQRFYERFLPRNDTPPERSLHQGRYTAEDSAHNTKMQVFGFAVKWMLSKSLDLGRNIFKLELASLLDEGLQVLANGSPNWNTFMCNAGAVVGYGGVLATYNMFCYFNGTKSLRRCFKDLITDVVPFVTQIVVGGAVVGLLTCVLGPIGFWAGIVIGGLVGLPVSSKVREYVDKWTLEMFDLPRDKAVEKAYSTLGLTKSATNSEINRACRQISFDNHPDTLARKRPIPSDREIKLAVERFIECQKSTEFIKMAREIEEANGRIERDGGDDEESWKRYFVQFFKNLVSSRRNGYANVNNNEEGQEAIEFPYAFPPRDVFQDNVGLAAQDELEMESVFGDNEPRVRLELTNSLD